MKILIITAFFPPQNSIASLRPYSWAKFWGRDGHDVTVITTTKKKSPGNSPMPCKKFVVLEIPIPGLSTIRRIIGKKSTLSRTHSQHGISNSRNGNFPGRKLLHRIQKKTGCFYGCRMPDPYDFWAQRAYSFAATAEWDLVVSTAGPYSVHLPALKLRKYNLAKKWIADWRDLWVDNHIFPGLPGVRLIENRLERKICQAADRITTVSAPLASELSQKHNRNVDVIFNGFDEEDYRFLPAAFGHGDSGKKKIVYTGTIYPPFQDPTPLFRAVRSLTQKGLLSPAKLEIVFCGNNTDFSKLADGENVDEFVRYAGFLPRKKALSMQRKADALLFLEFESDRLKGILTGKLFEYLYAGPPIIAVGIGTDSGAGKIIDQADAGICCGRDIEKIQRVILDLIHKNGLFSDDYARGTKSRKKVLAFYSRKNQAKRMLNLVG